MGVTHDHDVFKTGPWLNSMKNCRKTRWFNGAPMANSHKSLGWSRRMGLSHRYLVENKG
jgi:hypothetical protein